VPCASSFVVSRQQSQYAERYKTGIPDGMAVWEVRVATSLRPLVAVRAMAGEVAENVRGMRERGG
jgi:hypothetical protein